MSYPARAERLGKYDKLIYTSSRKSKRDEKNVFMAEIDNKKAYDKVSSSWIIVCLKMYKISNKLIKLIKETTKD